MTPTQTHAALLISLKDSDFWPADMSLNKWADLVCDELRRLDAENQRLQALLAKLQPAQEPAQAGEPVARIKTWHKGQDRHADLLDWCDGIDALPAGTYDLYARAALSARKPLTEEQRAKVFRDAETRMVYDLNLSWRNAVIDEVERAHGIDLEVKT